MKVVFVGIGLIGGSFALEIKNLYPNSEILAADKDENNLQEAISLKMIDKKAQDSDFFDADLVFLCIPVTEIKKILPEILSKIGENTLVIDVGSTKKEICISVENHFKRDQFLASHPIAGTEFSGAKSAFLGLFKNKVMIVCEVEKTHFKLQEKALKLFSDIGFRLRYMPSDTHDVHFAYVSHLSHIISYMLGKTVMQKEQSERDIFDMAGSGFASTVRLAKSGANMWVPIFKENKTHILESLSAYIENLENFKRNLEKDNFEEIFKEIIQINNIRYVLEGK